MAKTVDVRFRIADKEPFLSLVSGVTEAARIFTGLPADDLDATPPAVRRGIAALFRALADFTGDESLLEAEARTRP